MELDCCYRTKVDSKAFAFPYSDCISLYNLPVRIGIANALELPYVL